MITVTSGSDTRVRDLVRPVRFTDDVEAVARFLEVVGLGRESEADGGGWVVLSAGRGAVAVHSASSSDLGAAAGETHLSFVSAGLDALVADLRGTGLDVTPYDEAWGRALVVPAPDGHEIQVDTDSGESYGYHQRAGSPDDRTTVRPVWYLPLELRDDARTLLGAFGLAPRPGEDEWWAACEGPGGAVGLHRPTDDSPVCELGLETSEPLADVAARLVAAGHPAEVGHAEGVGEVLRVTDPDGRELEIHPAPPVP
ncbi:VOC family protein [uncultured Nocardioides sp.]|uniref:VOC family protein n=1 Tax=uncultured Nocardioides sp. TaxID=198441 RepID=UPI002636F790|nr:VOC family protein [uncultured Nocardioides sp.]